MGNKRNRRSKRLRTLSPEGDLSEIQLETSTQGNDTIVNIETNAQGTSYSSEIRPRLIESSQISNEIQAWNESFEQKNNDRILKMREEMENKLDAILKTIKSNKSASIATNPRPETNDTQNMEPSGSRIGQSSNGVNASYDENSDTDDEDYPLQASKMKDLRHPAKLFYRSDSNLDETLVSEEDSEEEDYHISL